MKWEVAHRKKHAVFEQMKWAVSHREMLVSMAILLKQKNNNYISNTLEHITTRPSNPMQ
jgi:hypothetical protein